MEEIKLTNTRIRGEYLTYDEDDKNLYIPEGTVISKKALAEYEFYIQKHQDTDKLIARKKGHKGDIEILPIYSKNIEITYSDRKMTINIHIVNNKNEYTIGNGIINSTHYLKAPNKGLMMIAEFCSTDDRDYIIKSKKDIYDKCSQIQKIYSDNSLIIGCIVLDKLTYSNPIGRINIANEMNIDIERFKGLDAEGNKLENKYKLNEILEMLRVAWISRIAVLPIYQGIGIGTALVENIGIVASTRCIPTAKYLEVFTTHKKQVAMKIKEEKKRTGFLIEAGFSMHEELLDSKPMYVEATKKFEVHKKLYYYKKLEESNETK